MDTYKQNPAVEIIFCWLVGRVMQFLNSLQLRFCFFNRYNSYIRKTIISNIMAIYGSLKFICYVSLDDHFIESLDIFFIKYNVRNFMLAINIRYN